MPLWLLSMVGAHPVLLLTAGSTMDAVGISMHARLCTSCLCVTGTVQQMKLACPKASLAQRGAVMAG